MEYIVVENGLHYCDKNSTPIEIGTIVSREQVYAENNPTTKSICKFGNCIEGTDGGKTCAEKCLLASGKLKEVQND